MIWFSPSWTNWKQRTETSTQTTHRPSAESTQLFVDRGETGRRLTSSPTAFSQKVWILCHFLKSSYPLFFFFFTYCGFLSLSSLQPHARGCSFKATALIVGQVLSFVWLWSYHRFSFLFVSSLLQISQTVRSWFCSWWQHGPVFSHTVVLCARQYTLSPNWKRQKTSAAVFQHSLVGRRWNIFRARVYIHFSWCYRQILF